MNNKNSNMINGMNWMGNFAQLIAETGKDGFLAHFSQTLQAISPYESSVIFGYVRGTAPILLYSDLEAKDEQSTLNVYMKGGYLLDPFYIMAQENTPEGLYRLVDMAPDDFYLTEYFLTYYQATRLKDEMNLFIRLSDDVSVIISLGLRDDFIGDVDHEFTQIELFKPILIELARKHFQLSDFLQKMGVEGNSSEHELGNMLNIAFNNFGRDVLSGREREIVLLILKGYSSKAIARLLEISPETVKVHRKRMHTKLEITSQAELFSLFIASLSMVEQDLNADPLALYLAEFT